MAIERERKFRVISKLLPMGVLRLGVGADGDGVTRMIESGYFTQNGVAIRVTIATGPHSDTKCKVCFKSPAAMERQEFEYTIPEEDAQALMKLSPTSLRKERFDYQGWEIDRIIVNYGVPGIPVLTDLWVAEWEETPSKQAIPSVLPDWIGEEVTNNPEFSMQYLSWRYGHRHKIDATSKFFSPAVNLHDGKMEVDRALSALETSHENSAISSIRSSIQSLLTALEEIAIRKNRKES